MPVRKQKSIASIQNILSTFFHEHPASKLSADNEPLIPADALREALDALINTAGPTGVPVLWEHETSKLHRLLTANPDLKVSPTIFLECLDFSSRDRSATNEDRLITLGGPIPNPQAITIEQEEHERLQQELISLRQENERLKLLPLKPLCVNNAEVQTDAIRYQVDVTNSAPHTHSHSRSKRSLYDQPPAYQHDGCDDGIYAIPPDPDHQRMTAASVQVEESAIPGEDLERWMMLKGKLGVDCEVITKFIGLGATSTNRVTSVFSPLFRRGDHHRSCPSGREGGSLKMLLVIFVTLLALHILSWGVVVVLIVRPFVFSPLVPGGATYADRAAWTSYNTIQAPGEGLIHLKDSPGVRSRLGWSWMQEPADREPSRNVRISPT